jgi:hypothetical protein
MKPCLLRQRQLAENGGRLIRKASGTDGNWHWTIQIADNETIVYTTRIVIGTVRMGR